MRRLLASLVLVVTVAACGGGASDGGGGTAGSASAPAPAAGGDLPAGSSVLFGSAYDPATLAVANKATNIKAGSPMVAVGRALAPLAPAGVTVQVGAGGNAKPPRPVTVSDNADKASYFAFDLTPDALAPGTWIVSFVNANGHVLASGYLTVSP